VSAWDSFFTAEVGASAALAGLLFVGISINIAKILAIPSLPDVALRALSLLFAILLVASVLLIPGLGSTTLGGILIAFGATLTAVVVGISLRGFHRTEPNYRLRRSLEFGFVSLIALAAGLYPVAGVVTLLGGSQGNYLLAAAFLLSFTIAITDSWVLLIEINR
jgi:hypothetical protein